MDHQDNYCFFDKTMPRPGTELPQERPLDTTAETRCPEEQPATEHLVTQDPAQKTTSTLQTAASYARELAPAFEKFMRADPATKDIKTTDKADFTADDDIHAFLDENPHMIYRVVWTYSCSRCSFQRRFESDAYATLGEAENHFGYAYRLQKDEKFWDRLDPLEGQWSSAGRYVSAEKYYSEYRIHYLHMIIERINTSNGPNPFAQPARKFSTFLLKDGTGKILGIFQYKASADLALQQLERGMQEGKGKWKRPLQVETTRLRI